jgi:hypothetical protein
MLSEAAAWHSPQAMQPNGPPGIPPADGRPAFLGNTTVEVIRDVAAAAAKQVAAVLLHNPPHNVLGRGGCRSPKKRAIGDALRSHRDGRQTIKMATAVDDLDRKLPSLRRSSAHGQGNLSRRFKGFADLGKNVGEGAGFGWPGGVGSLLRCGRGAQR